VIKSLQSPPPENKGEIDDGEDTEPELDEVLGFGIVSSEKCFS